MFPVTWTLQWRPQQVPVRVEFHSQLDRLLDLAERDAKQAQIICELRSPDGASLTIGLNGEVSVATFATSGARLYFVSDGGPTDGLPLVFFRDGHWSEFDSQSAISNEAAREAAREFRATGGRPDNIAWREV
jgi:hypothetical protein